MSERQARNALEGRVSKLERMIQDGMNRSKVPAHSHQMEPHTHQELGAIDQHLAKLDREMDKVESHLNSAWVTRVGNLREREPVEIPDEDLTWSQRRRKARGEAP